MLAEFGDENSIHLFRHFASRPAACNNFFRSLTLPIPEEHRTITHGCQIEDVGEGGRDEESSKWVADYEIE